MNHAYRPLLKVALRRGSLLYRNYTEFYSRGRASLRRVGLHGRGKAVVIFDRTMAGETRGEE